jgi:hypothetical protein
MTWEGLKTDVGAQVSSQNNLIRFLAGLYYQVIVMYYQGSAVSRSFSFLTNWWILFLSLPN